MVPHLPDLPVGQVGNGGAKEALVADPASLGVLDVEEPLQDGILAAPPQLDCEGPLK